MTERPGGEIQSPAAWVAADVTEDSWLRPLTPDEVAEIRDAALGFAASGQALTEISRDSFALPRFGDRLREIVRSSVLEGKGFAVLRKLNLEGLDIRAIAAAFLGLGVHLGGLRPQNAKGHLLGHVMDLGRSSSDPTARLYQTHERQTYHTDSCDVVALLCLQKARAGGQSSLVSSVTLHNEIMRRRPDLAAVLFEPIETDRRGEEAPGEAPYFRIPVFNWRAGRFAGMYQRQYIESSRRFPDVAPLTPEQVEALDLLDALAEDPRLHVTLDFEPGDVQLVNNHVLFHDRTAFEDWPEPERRRHLLRLWIAPPEAQPLPEIFAERFGSVTPGARGGVSAAPALWNAPLAP